MLKKIAIFLAKVLVIILISVVIQIFFWDADFFSWDLWLGVLFVLVLMPVLAFLGCGFKAFFFPS